MPSFCFAKSDLRVWEDIWEKSSRKMNDIVEKTWKLFAFKTMTLSGKLATKKWRTNIGIFFVILHAVFLLNVFLQQFLKLMSKMEKYDGSSCIAKMLNFGSQTLKMLEFTSWNDLLLSHSQHFWFPKNAFWESDFEKMLDAVFMRPQNFGTKFKIYKKVLNICWIARVLIWRKVFFSSETC